MSAPNVLFFYMPDYLPLVHAVMQRGINLVVSESPLRKHMQAAGLSFQRLEGFVSPEVQASVYRKVGQIASGLNEVLREPAVRRAFFSRFGFFLGYTGKGFFRQLLELFIHEIVMVDTLESFLQRDNLDLIVLGFDNAPPDRALVNYAAVRGIPTLQLAHGIYVKPVARIAGNMPTLYSDYIAVFGTRARDIMMEIGTAVDRIYITGNPCWDPLYSSEARLDRREACRRLQLDPERPVVLFFASYADGSSAFSPAVMRRLLATQRTLIQLMQNLGGKIQLIVRPHPQELQRSHLAPQEKAWLDEAYTHWIQQHGNLSIRLLREQKVEAIRAADIVIVVRSSTTIPEAMILERPVVVIPLFKQQDLVYTKQDGIVVIDDDAQLPYVLSNLLHNAALRETIVQRQNSVLPELNHGNDGRATERTAELIVKLATSSQKGRKRNNPCAFPH